MSEIGGVRTRRPFKIRRISHIGLNALDMVAMRKCYGEYLGLIETDISENLANMFDPDHSLIPEDGARGLYFYRYGGDHHQFVLMDRRLWGKLEPENAHLGVNQISWQVGSLQEVANAIETLGGEQQRIKRSGRDMPGSNWHTYVLDPDGITFELTFGMEQIGWNRLSKPVQSWDSLRFREFPSMPHQAENVEMAKEREAGIDFSSCFRPEDEDGDFEVEGVRMPRPFKIIGMGPFSTVAEDLDRSVEHYVNIFGFEVRARGEGNGVRYAALYCNTSHHALMVYDRAAREVFGLTADATLVATGFQLATYTQLKDAVAFLTERGLEEVEVPGELVPGFDHVAHLRDPDGNLIQLYFQMRQCLPGDGREGRASITGPARDWPETIDASDDAFMGEVFMGPWA